MIQQPDIQLFLKMGDVSRDGFFIFDQTSLSFNYLNPSLPKIFQTEYQLIRNHPHTLINFVSPDDVPHVKSCYEELMEEGGEKKYVFRIELSPEKEKSLKCTTFALQIENRKLICGILEDITVEKENQIHIEQINARKDVTLEVLSHDMKEPFAMIKMAVSSIQNLLKDGAGEQLSNSLKFINDMCERNIKLIRSMVNHEFLKSSVIAIKKERVDLVWELTDVVRFYRRSHLRHARRFNFESSNDKIYISLDSLKFMQVVNNLISNSIKFTKTGGTIGIYAEDRGDTVVISVSDDGIGIPQDIKQNLFKNSKKNLRKGLNGEESGGLGMGIIKDMVDLHRGKIWVVSEVNVGTTFYIELPKGL